mmetsp:Transcript_1459/g.3218  ORF Transcript_1459/g.3218 Transcript_1459/m.3218 type:complete len:265 (-) Transcript_1459:430-1224(-)|eukprot:CAMPEP_0202895752 /NCGR_PEP_ID=MMETSP1392-20130828/4894_1 /ASSEMBLY_ACC=CAM_ASM_000868 /TAXON_ID=225041 /ORGANISM="Chlamydomonas chlamydogama, Strain SAG 11-48b" /LENGTH=264 /DNA_ID=CAMNT_0049580879 /DNA_START=1535 /DNA_END=2329 /DNA_ORIENTATION=+
MGKGGGACTSAPAQDESEKQATTSTQSGNASSSEQSKAVPRALPEAPSPSPPAAAKVPQPITKMVKVYIIYYSTYGHIRQLAEAAKKGVEQVEGVTATIYQVAETLPAEVLEKMHAPPKADYPVLDPHNLPEADAFLIGFPTRFGAMAAQMKAFWDATGGHWQKQSLAGKPFGLFTSTASQVGGQETTLLGSIPIFAHQGMIYVPNGYGAGAPLFDVDNVRGGGPLGSGTIAGATGARQPSAGELQVTEFQGKNLATIAKKLAA